MNKFKFQKINKKVWLIILLLVTDIISWGYLFFGDASAINHYFIESSNFSDFFTPMQKSVDNAYKEPHFSNYPPLANIFFLFIKKFGLATEYSSYLNDTAYGICFILFVSMSILAIYEISKRYLQNDLMVMNKLCLLLLLASGPFLFLYSRSNILLGIIPLLMFYVKNYDSDNKYLRELALISLALATAIKIYPVIFGLLLIKKGNFKTCLKASLYGVILFFGPFLVFGINSIGLFVENLFLRDNSTSYNYVLNHTIGIKGAIQMIAGLILNRIVWDYLTFIWIMFLLAMLYIFIISKVKWKQCFALSMLCIWIFNSSYLYNMCLLIIPILLFLENEKDKLDYIYTFLFGMLFAIKFLPDTDKLNVLLAEAHLGQISWAIVITNILLIITAIIVFIDAATEKNVP